MRTTLGVLGYEVEAGDFWTDGNNKNRRLRVDVGQTSFFAGREFRTFKEFYSTDGTQIAAGATYVVRAVVPINIILAGLELNFDNGVIRCRTVVGGTPGGTFSEVLPIFARNTMTERPAPFYTPQVALTAGGTHTGGTVLDTLRLKVENATGGASSVGSSEGDERGVVAGTYYFLLQNISAGIAEGTFKARWEERP